jgi:hypothetical protein
MVRTQIRFVVGTVAILIIASGTDRHHRLGRDAARECLFHLSGYYQQHMQQCTSPCVTVPNGTNQTQNSPTLAVVGVRPPLLAPRISCLQPSLIA